MPTSKSKKQYYHDLFSKEIDLIDRVIMKRDSSNMPLYQMKCPICKDSRGFLRMQAAFLPCKKCGQKKKITGRKGKGITESTRLKIKEANKRRNLKERGFYGTLSKIEKKILHTCRSRVWQALKGLSKGKKTLELLSCSVLELKTHLEAKFQPSMTWDNYGFYGWHIDHIKPLSAFDLSNPEQLKKACHHSNLQPLWAKDNLSKGSKYAAR